MKLRISFLSLFFVIAVGFLSLLGQPKPAQAASSWAYGLDNTNQFGIYFGDPPTKLSLSRFYLYSSNTKYHFTDSFLNETLDVNGADPGHATYTTSSGTQQVTIQNVQLFNSQFPNANQSTPDTPETAIVTVDVRVNYNGYANSSTSLSADTITLVSPDHKTTYDTQPASGPAPGPNQSSHVDYIGQFSSVQPNQQYQVCSQILAGFGDPHPCSDTFTKLPGAIFAVTMTSSSTYDITKAPATTVTSEDQCTSTVKSVGWLVCGVVGWIEDAMTKVESDVLSPLLSTTPLQTGGPIYKVWSGFRDLATVAFVLVFLFIIFANTLSLGIDAYTVKKTLPRLVAAAVLVQFSFFIASLAIDITNILGEGIGNIMTQPITGQPVVLKGGTISIGIAAIVASAAGAFTAALSGALVFGFIALMLAVIGVIFTLIFRQVLITILVVLSPLAFVAWILPNTEGLFKLWWKNFTRALLMYPLIFIMFGGGKLMLTASSATQGGGSGVSAVVGLIALTAPLFLIPWAFKWAGGAMAIGASAINKRAAGYGSRVKSSQMAKDWRNSASNSGFLQAAEGRNALSRGIGRLRSGPGNFLPVTSSAKRRLASNYQKISGERRKEEKAGLISEINKKKLFGDDAREHLRKIASDPKAKASKREAAIDTMIEKADFDGLRKVRSGLDVDHSPAAARLWQNGTSERAGDLFKKAPDLMLGSGAFKTVSAEQLADMHHSTVAQYMEHISKLPAGAEQDQARTAFMGTLRQVMDSPTLSARLNNNARENIRRETMAKQLGDTPLFAGADADFINDHIGVGGVPIKGGTKKQQTQNQQAQPQAEQTQSSPTTQASAATTTATATSPTSPAAITTTAPAANPTHYYIDSSGNKRYMNAADVPAYTGGGYDVIEVGSAQDQQIEAAATAATTPIDTSPALDPNKPYGYRDATGATQYVTEAEAQSLSSRGIPVFEVSPTGPYSYTKAKDNFDANSNYVDTTYEQKQIGAGEALVRQIMGGRAVLPTDEGELDPNKPYGYIDDTGATRYVAETEAQTLNKRGIPVWNRLTGTNTPTPESTAPPLNGSAKNDSAKQDDDLQAAWERLANTNAPAPARIVTDDDQQEAWEKLAGDNTSAPAIPPTPQPGEPGDVIQPPASTIPSWQSWDKVDPSISPYWIHDIHGQWAPTDEALYEDHKRRGRPVSGPTERETPSGPNT